MTASARWAPVPDALLRSGLPERTVLVYAILLRHADGNGVAWPSQRTLAEAVHKSVPTIERAVRELREAGWITTSRRRTGFGLVYRMHESPVAEACDPPLMSDGSHPSEMRGHEREPRNEKGQLAAQAPPRAAVAAKARRRLEAARDAALDPAQALGLWESPPAVRAAQPHLMILDETAGFESAPRPAPRRPVGADGPMGLALWWRRRMQERHVAGALDANVKALARYFKTMLAEGASPEAIRRASDLYAQHEGLRNPQVAPWRDFLYQRHLLLARALRALGDEQARADPAAHYRYTPPTEQELRARGEVYRQQLEDHLAAAT